MALPNLLDRLLIWLDARRVRGRGDPEHHQLAGLISPGQIALDVGANHGVYTYSLMLCGARVHAIEPNPLLAKRLRGAALRGVTVHEAAVGAAPGQAQLFVPRHRKGYQDDPAGRLTNEAGDGWRFPVDIITIDSLGLSPVAFLKIDVEGYEDLALKGGWATIARDRPTVLIELEDARQPGCRQDIIGRFTDIGYSAWYFDQGDWREEAALGANQRTANGRYINNFLLTPGPEKPPASARPA
jgi:FkbM family methyltransferase